MNFSLLKKIDTANGKGVRVSFFVSGCRHNCPGCFNHQAADFNYGEPFTKKTLDEIIEALAPKYIDGITFLGGDPMEPENQVHVLEIISKIREIYGNSKTIWIYTGATFENLTNPFKRYWIQSYLGSEHNVTENILKNSDVLVDGPFVQNLKDLSLRFRGSSNQRIIDLKKTFECGQVVLFEDFVGSQ